MGGLVFILPILAFDVWLACTTGRTQWVKWRQAKAWRPMAAAVIVGVVLAAIFATLDWHQGDKLRLKGLPAPFEFSYLEDNKWVTTDAEPLLVILARVTDAITGLAAPLIPFKIGEFLLKVKEELK